jgi:hypothetical protein
MTLTLCIIASHIIIKAHETVALKCTESTPAAQVRVVPKLYPPINNAFKSLKMRIKKMENFG